jgi:hypothetical protein
MSENAALCAQKPHDAIAICTSGVRRERERGEREGGTKRNPDIIIRGRRKNIIQE